MGVDLSAVKQTVEGFGSCFNELGWTSLQELSEADRAAIFQELYTPAGANFTMARMPLGSNDFSIDYYSYDEVDGDLALAHFSINHDQATLIPFIRAAKAVTTGPAPCRPCPSKASRAAFAWSPSRPNRSIRWCFKFARLRVFPKSLSACMGPAHGPVREPKWAIGYGSASTASCRAVRAIGPQASSTVRLRAKRKDLSCIY